MAPKPKTETITDENLEDFRKTLATVGEHKTALLLILTRLQMAYRGGEISQSAAAFEFLSQLHRAYDLGGLKVNGGSIAAQERSKSTPSIKIPMWVFEALAVGWNRYVEEGGKSLDEAMSIRQRRGQGQRSPGESIRRILRNLNLTHEVVIHRIYMHKRQEPLSIEKACEDVALEIQAQEDREHITAEVVRAAYKSERENYKTIMGLIGFKYDAQ